MDRRLIHYLPPFMQDYREMQEIMGTEQQEIEKADTRAMQILDNAFVCDADTRGIERYERIIGITPEADATLEDRKFTISLFFKDPGYYTMESLKDYMTNLLGTGEYEMELKNDLYTLVLKISLTAKNRFQDAMRYLEKVLPANMVIDMSLLYNQHQTLKRFTNKELGGYTHEKLRNEVLL